MTSPTLNYLVKKYGLVMDARQVAEAIGMSYDTFLNLRHTGKRDIPAMTKKGGKKLVTTAVVVAKYLDSITEESSCSS